MKGAAVSSRRRLTPSRRLEMQAGHQFVFFPCTLMHVFFLALYIQPRLRTGLFFGMQLQLITQAQSLDLLFKQDTHAVNKNFVVQRLSGVCIRLRHINIRCKSKHTLRDMMSRNSCVMCVNDSVSKRSWLC